MSQLDNSTIGQIIIFITVIAGYGYNLYRENRNRRWDHEDRARIAKELATTVKTTEVVLVEKVKETGTSLAEVTLATQVKQDKLMNKIDQNTEITKAVYEKAEDTKLKVQRIAAMYDAALKRDPTDLPKA